MQDIALHQNQIIDMHVENSEDSDSSADVLLELAEAWSYVKKWYSFSRKGGSITKKVPSNGSSVTFHKNKSKVTKNEPISQKINFQDLPVSVQVEVFSWLDVNSLSKAASVSRQWYNLTSDEILWEKKLARDSKRWQVIDHLSHPDLYKDAAADLSSKEIYLNCCPECKKQKSKPTFKFHIPKISFYFGLSIPKVVMFGPGLESETSGIVKKIFSDPSSPFTVKGMFPGQFDGVGSGVSLQFDGGLINLITLYSASRNEREANSANGVRRNKFLVERNLDEDAENVLQEEVNLSVTLTQPVRDLCSTVDAFIFVVDSTMDKDLVKLGIDELKAVMGSRSLKTQAPILVLSCVPDANTRQYSSIAVADELGLRELNRPWQVRACQVASLYGLLPGTQWLLNEVMNS